MKKVAWWATVYEVTKELDTTLQLTNNLFKHSHTHTHIERDRQTDTKRQKQREADTEREIKTCSRKI